MQNPTCRGAFESLQFVAPKSFGRKFRAITYLRADASSSSSSRFDLLLDGVKAAARIIYSPEPLTSLGHGRGSPELDALVSSVEATARWGTVRFGYLGSS